MKLNVIYVEAITTIMEAVIKAAENMMIKAVENVLVSSLTDGPTAQSTMWRCMAASRQPKYPLMSLAPVMDEPDDQLNAEGHLTAIKRFLLFFISLSPDAVLLTDAEAAELEQFKRTQTCVEGMTLADKEGLEVERLFSVARAVLRHERHRLSLMMLEMILFLKINSSYWDGATGEQCL
ncbi:hypothetical protein PF002_g5098 [Phytophthora fragariae]|uniref:Uncharacterized protein n=1 Tax=Phytophthora fragariae TaxID=53985 RepID=A0A6A4A3S8_9STRA|nr:hypothetical protein PF002_g5098 [Phytophthora fragariae]